jgi:hypothetical protein
MRETILPAPYYYVASPAANGRQRKRWVWSIGGTGPELSDTSYCHDTLATVAEAEALALAAKAKFPTRKFSVRKSLDGNAYEVIKDIC